MDYELEKEDLLQYFLAIKLLQNSILIRDGNKYTLDMRSLLDNNPRAHEFFLNNPEEVRRIICDSFELFKGLNKIERFKIINFSYLHPISILRVEHIDKLVKVQGMISKTTKVVALVISKKWECPTCGTVITTNSPKEPRVCSCGRRGGFNVLSTTFADIQEIELEELQDTLEDRQPQKIRIRFLHELCDKEISGILQPGNKIEVIGVVEKTQVFKKQKEDEEIFEYRVNAYDLNSLEERYNDTYISEEDEKQIKEIALNNPLDQLSGSLAPSIHGHDDVKKAIILQMVGGIKRVKADGSIVRDRSHLLIVGDAGTGKSHLAKCAKVRTPKSYYVSGDESSKAGLVAMVDKDELLNQWCVKAGALSKANDSILIIDEADKLTEEDRSALHTPMESGEIILNKAGIHTSLKAACSILAIANPKEGMFDLENPDKTITKQINLPPTLLSRFDLIFVMTDIIDERNDSSIVDSIYSGKKAEGVIEIELFRKYITYAKKQNPKRREELVENIKKFYNKVRSQSVAIGTKMRGMPITPRHIEGILRLAEAHAKLRLGEYVEESDLKIAQDLFSNSLLKLGMDEREGILDFARIGSGKTFSRKLKCRIIVQVVKSQEEEYGKFVPYILVKEKSLEHGISSLEFDDLFSELMKAGELIEPKSGQVQAV